MPLPVGLLGAPPAAVRERNALLALTATDENEVGAQRVASDRYWLFQKITASLYWIAMFEPTYGGLDTGLLGLLYHALGRLGVSFDDKYGLGTVTGVNQDAASVTRVGSWSGLNSNAAAYGGDYRYSTTSGATVSFTPPVNCTAVGLYTLTFPNGGFAKAEIDGDTSKCNLLSTAQELVDAGTMPASAISGGTFSASDRVVSFYSASNIFNRDIPVASGLTLASHTLKLTVKSTVPTGGSSNRTYDSGYYYGTSATGISTVHYGSGWSVDNTRASAYGGTYKYTTTSGDKVKFTAPASTGVSLRTVVNTNGGVAKVKIDGSATAANKLKTAQQMVNDGDLSATYLSGVGGPLNGTDRVVSFYQPNPGYDYAIDLADGLANTTHTVEIICTSARETGSSGNRLFSSGYAYSNSSMVMGDAGVGVVPTRMIQYDQSYIEYALDINVAGGVHTIVGNGHGYDYPVSFTFSVDDTPVTLAADGDVAYGETVAITRVSDLKHPNSGGASIGGSTTVYTLTSGGLVIDWNIGWTSDIFLVTGWVAMFAMSDRYLNRASIVGDTVDYDMVENNNSDIEYGKLQSDCAYIWDPTNDDVIALFWNQNQPESVLGWQYTSKKLFVQDRAGPKFTKIYLQSAYSQNVSIPAGSNWHSRSLYRVAYVPGINAQVAH